VLSTSPPLTLGAMIAILTVLFGPSIPWYPI
jgi:hypothetical protein